MIRWVKETMLDLLYTVHFVPRDIYSLDTYRENLEDIDTGEVQFFIFAVHWKRHRYMTEVL